MILLQFRFGNDPDRGRTKWGLNGKYCKKPTAFGVYAVTDASWKMGDLYLNGKRSPDVERFERGGPSNGDQRWWIALTTERTRGNTKRILRQLKCTYVVSDGHHCGLGIIRQARRKAHSLVSGIGAIGSATHGRRENSVRVSHDCSASCSLGRLVCEKLGGSMNNR